jgi:hypothetical protein
MSGMRPLIGHTLLELWERGLDQPTLDRTVTLVELGCDGLSRADIATMPIAERDLRLLALRELSYGERLSVHCACGRCGERMEFVLPAAQLRQTLEAVAAPSDLVAEHAGFRLRLRIMDTIDLAAAAAAETVEAGMQILLRRCVQADDPDGRPVPVETLPAATATAALRHLDELHRNAELLVELTCPACAEPQSVPFEIGKFLWAEARHHAERLIEEVHELARAYGWSEDSILAMSQRRRHAYLARVWQ